MRCNQKLCLRTKNLSKSVNVCEDGIKKVEDSHKKVDQNKVKQIMDIQKKLANGEANDPNTVNILLLSGIFNIISQHDVIDDLQKKIRALEHDDITSRSRIESLKKWSLK